MRISKIMDGRNEYEGIVDEKKMWMNEK